MKYFIAILLLIIPVSGFTKSLCVDVDKIEAMLPALYLEIISDECGSGIPTPPDVTPEVPVVEYNSKEVYPMQWMAQHNRSFTWLGHTGSFYGGKVRMSFDNGCPAIVIPDATDNYGRTGGQPAYFCGTKNKPEESAGILSSIFSSNGCRASTVTVEFNK